MERAIRLAWSWHDRSGKFSSLKSVTLALMTVPALWMLYSALYGEFGITPLGELTFWSGIWSMAILPLALTVTPLATIFRWPRLLVVRRMIGVTALIYTGAHIIIYFALRFWNFTVIGNEIATSVSLLAATVSTLGLIALGATSLDAAIQRIGTLANNFSLVLGVSPAWKVLIFGLLITLAATWHTLHTRQAAT